MSAASAEEAAFVEALPKEVQNGLNFVSSLLVVLFGFALRRVGLIRDEHIPGMQALTFTFCLPMLVLIVLWSMELRLELLKVLGFSTVIHGSWFLMAWVLVQTRAARPSERGFLAMALTGSGLDYVYPVLLGSDRFGMDSVGMVAMYDLGGNMPVNIIMYSLMASLYAPAHFMESQEEAPVEVAISAVSSHETTSELRPRPRAATSDTLAADDAQGPAPCAVGITSEDVAVQVLPSVSSSESDASQQSKSPVESQSKTGAKRVLDLAKPITRNPVIYSVLVGLSLNILEVPLYPLPVRAVRGLVACYPPLLYALLGVSLRFDLGRRSYGLVARALLFRIVLCSAVVIFVRYVLPLDNKARGVLTVCAVSPIAAPFIMYSAQFGYRMDQSAMTYNLSAMISMLVMNVIVRFA
eukprot:TRINITY_DN20342_c0_g1_i1.p1 TRINITY_DN20342_c0_g1~~TRINITY_DN20342_c0_g1_i1.p1  ORF type:complete len:411 (+),score=34.80 TRINITY_DN20342_c0_g1_i1:32-1264(+)